MKLNTISKGLVTCMLVGALALGVNACSKIEKPKQEIELKQKVKIEEKIYKHCIITLFPKSKTGQTLEVVARTWDDKYNSYNVREMKLYESGKLIETKKGDDNNDLEVISKTLTHKEPGTYSYYAEFIYEDGYIKKTDIKSIKFTGTILDLPPSYATILPLENKLFLCARDDGDNKGIAHIKVYENGHLWKEINFEPKDFVDFVAETVPLDLSKKGKHEYYAEFTDQGGNTISTDAVIIYFITNNN